MRLSALLIALPIWDQIYGELPEDVIVVDVAARQRAALTLPVSNRSGYELRPNVHQKCPSDLIR